MDELADGRPAVRPYLREKAFGAGRWVEAVRGGPVVVRNPATGALLGRLPDCGREEVAEAVAAAKAAFPSWKARTAAERAAALRRLADLVEAGTGPLAVRRSSSPAASATPA